MIADKIVAQSIKKNLFACIIRWASLLYDLSVMEKKQVTNLEIAASRYILAVMIYETLNDPEFDGDMEKAKADFDSLFKLSDEEREAIKAIVQI